LRENNVGFTEIDVSKDEGKAEEMIEKSGQMGVPVIDVDGQIIVGFDKEKIRSVLGLQ
jgi:glutaredoxin